VFLTSSQDGVEHAYPAYPMVVLGDLGHAVATGPGPVDLAAGGTSGWKAPEREHPDATSGRYADL
jgi:hypothetical protein